MNSFARTFRSLRQTPVTTLGAVLTLGLGVTACTVVFTLADALLLKPLPYAEPHRLAALSSIDRDERPGGLSWADLRGLRDQSGPFTAIAGFTTRTWGVTAAAQPRPEVVLSGMVTADFFRALGAGMTLGQGFEREFELPGSNRVIWLTHQFWSRRFRSDPSVIGASLSLNGVAHRVQGVLAEGFRFPMRGGTPEVYIPLDMETYCCAPQPRSLEVIARLGDAATLQAAAQQLHAASPPGVKFVLEDLQGYLAGQHRRPLLLLTSAVALLMLIAALNAGGILLARATGRLQEAAIKASLGAPVSRLMREQLEQGVVIGLAAAVGGFAGASLLLPAATRFGPAAAALDGYARVFALTPDWRVALFCGLAALAAALCASTAPLLLLRPARLEGVLRGAVNRTAPRTRSSLVVMQVALTTMLLGSAAMLGRSLWNVLSVERGFRTESVVSAGIGIPEARYNTDGKMIGFHDQVLERLRAIPGVRMAGGGAGLPLHPMSTRFLLPDGAGVAEAARPRADAAVASPELLSVLGIPLVRGRPFGPQDRWGGPFVALVNQQFARRYFAGRDPIGTRMRLSFYNGFTMKPWSEFEIIGIVGDTRSRSRERAPEPMVVLSSRQIPMEGFIYYVLAEGPAPSLVNDIRQAVWSIDADIQAVSPIALDQRPEQGVDERKLTLLLLGGFAAMALLLAGVGLAAAITASVAECRREHAIRSAMGATPARIGSGIVMGAARLAGLGFSFGLAGFAIVSRMLESHLFGVNPLDTASIGATMLVLGITMLAACAAPALRAAATAPSQALR